MARFHLVVSRAVVTLLCLFALNAAALAQFEFRDSIIAQQQPYGIAVGDFNHDGKLDLAVAAAGAYSDDIVILLGRGDGTFRTPVYYTAGIGATSVVAADFNHDGNLDLAVASQSNYIGILMGNGDGTFQPATKSPPVIAFEFFVTVGDFNGDGKIDLITFGGSIATISVLLGNGNGTFQKALVTRPTFGLQTIGVGDFNRDGKLDVATAGVFGGTSPVNILLGNGDGTFRQGASYAGETSPLAIAVGDFNGDHNPDMAIANFQGAGISVWLGNGDGTFKPAVDYATSFPAWVTAADVNGDGIPDLIAANFGGSAGPAGATVFRGKRATVLSSPEVSIRPGVRLASSQ